MQNPSKSGNKIGDILVQCGMVTKAELEEALDAARKEHLRLGEALVKMGVLGADQLAWALGVQFDLSPIELNENLVDWDLLSTLPVEQLHGLMVLPIVPAEGKQRVVIADPTVEGLREFIEELFPDRKVLVQLASAHEMDELFEEMARRRHRVSHAGSSAPLLPSQTNALLRWIPRLESGRIERVIVVPRSQDEFAAASYPWTGEGAERLSAAEMRQILDLLYDHFTCESPTPFLTCGMRGLDRGGGNRAIRAVALETLTGPLLALEGISASPPPRKGRRLTVLECKDPIALKAALLAEAATARREATTPFLILSLESHVDFLVGDVIQCELGDPGVRMAACRRLISAARPNLLLLEIDSETQVASLPIEAACFQLGRVFVLLRGFVRPRDFPNPFEGVDLLSISPDPRAIRDQARALLRGPAGT